MRREIVYLNDIIAEIRNGLNAAQHDVLTEGMLPISRIETISDGTVNFERIKYAKVTEVEQKKYKLKEGDILFSHINSPEHIGKTALFRSERTLIHGINLLLLRCDQKLCYPEYLSYYLNTFEVRAEFRTRCKRAVNQASLNQGDILSLAVPLLPLNEQKRIATILTKADHLRRLRRYARELSDGYLQSVFLEMFGDPVSNPRRWPTNQLEKLCTKIIDCPHETPIYSSTQTPYACIRSSDIQKGFIDWSTTKYLDEEEYLKRIERGVPLTGDVFYCREGARFGNAARVPRGKKVCLGQRMMLFRAKPDVATSEFIWAFLEAESTYQKIVDLAGGSASPHVNIGDLRILPTILPPLPLQQKFAQIVQKYARLRDQQREAERQAEHLFQSLLHRAFRGEV